MAISEYNESVVVDGGTTHPRRPDSPAAPPQRFTSSGGAAFRAELIEAGVLRDGVPVTRSFAAGGGLRLDAAGRAAAARHLREGDHGRRLMPSPSRARAEQGRPW